jgi:hypothetical protein
MEEKDCLIGLFILLTGFFKVKVLDIKLCNDVSQIRFMIFKNDITLRIIIFPFIGGKFLGILNRCLVNYVLNRIRINQGRNKICFMRSFIVR